jgi:hypothetical protein
VSYRIQGWFEVEKRKNVMIFLKNPTDKNLSDIIFEFDGSNAVSGPEGIILEIGRVYNRRST